MGLEANAGVASSIDSSGPQLFGGPQAAGSKAVYQNSDSIVVRKNTLMASTGSNQDFKPHGHSGGHPNKGHKPKRQRDHGSNRVARRGQSKAYQGEDDEESKSDGSSGDEQDLNRVDDEDFEDMEDEELFDGDQKRDLMDLNLAEDQRKFMVRSGLEGADNDEQEALQAQGEMMDDADGSSAEEEDNQGGYEEHKTLAKIVYPDPPREFDASKFADEFERYDPSNVAEQMYARKERKIPGSVLKPHSPYCNLVQSNTLKIQNSVRVLFPYPAYCYKLNTQPSHLVFLDLQQEVVADPEQSLKIVHQYKMMLRNMTLGFKIHDSTHIYNSVVNTLKAAGFRIVPPNSNKWNILFTGMCKQDQLKDASKYQKINHFPQSYQIGRKDLMWKNIARAARVFQGNSNEYNFCPKTYIFPDDYRKFCYEREASGYKHMYIMKPSASSCGKGIKIIGPKT